jgi:hypothetical protein
MARKKSPPLRHDHDGKDRPRDDRDTPPLESVGRRVHDHAKSAGTDQAEHREFADVDSRRSNMIGQKAGLTAGQ